MRKNLTILICSIISLGIAGCANDLSSNSYDETVVGQTQTVKSGVIVNAEKVKINGNKNAGVLAGGAAGAVGGSIVGGSSRANLLGAVGGGLVGAVIGDAADKAINSQEGMRYFVKLQNDEQAKIVSIVQAAKPMLQVGQKVLVLEGGTGRSRVIADNG
jgi:outer membrane lipoprotein SlyB